MCAFSPSNPYPLWFVSLSKDSVTENRIVTHKLSNSGDSFELKDASNLVPSHYSSICFASETIFYLGGESKLARNFIEIDGTVAFEGDYDHGAIWAG
jgi:hypothetical protein